MDSWGDHAVQPQSMRTSTDLGEGISRQNNEDYQSVMLKRPF